ncbi:helix-turn-helix transcriptional regulator [Streptomyces sp. MUM 203J]|uniref:ArsR/SmtB family transcription factor n=1 Tax=Streptomyces sp. MUM 203J TaxID=2791990 RepID=UPI001F038A1D|nr:helix-turn-helix domain-containing protein [Streptomyces sp. MUM 203J]MCH0543077.1 helix-turn-helix transcriptional regulator [Streptomyces sp. MUM 203J]
MISDEGRRVLDPGRDAAALKALTHPLRIRLLGLLRQDGPATASELAVVTGESSASTSYHLRVLAKHGFVAEAEHRDGRERRWRAVHAVTSWDNGAMEASPVSRAFVSLSRRRQVEHLEASLVRYEADAAEGRLAPEWAQAAGISDLMPRLTPESLRELMETVARTVEELAARDAGDPRAEQVVFLAAGLPLAARVRDAAAAGESGGGAAAGGDAGAARAGGDGEAGEGATGEGEAGVRDAGAGS